MKNKKIKEEFVRFIETNSAIKPYTDELDWVYVWFEQSLKQARQEERKRILGIVEGMKYKPISKESPEWLRFGVGGYNKALTDIKKKI